MRVIEKGRPQKGWAKNFRCTGNGNGDGGCRAMLLVEEDDLFRTSRSSMGETDHYVTFRCCECGVLTDLKSGDHHFRAQELPSKAEWERKRAAPRREI